MVRQTQELIIMAKLIDLNVFFTQYIIYFYKQIKSYARNYKLKSAL